MRKPQPLGDPSQVATALQTPTEVVQLAVKSIDASPYQPRMDFPEAEIAGLADSIETHGQLQPISVRKKGKRYELLDGERRLRAIKSLQRPMIRAEIEQRSDAEARAIVLVSALQRKELNAIEEARAFQAGIDAGDAPGPTELARQLGLSQGHVSNRLRLLKLPESIRRRVISQEIPATHAREIAKYLDFPKLLLAIEKRLDAELKRNGDLGPVSYFAQEIAYALTAHTKPLEGHQWDSKTGCRVPVFAPSEEQAGRLGIVELHHGERRATNTKLWDQLQAAHRREWLKEQAKKAAAKSKSRNGKPKPKKLTPAQQKKLAEEERRRAKERADQFRRRLEAWKVDWQRYLVADFLLNRADPTELLRLAIVLAGRNGAYRHAHDSLQAMHRALKQNGVRPGGRGEQLCGLVLSLDEPAVAGFAAEVLSGWFYDEKEGPRPFIDAATVEDLVRYFGIDLADCWLDEQAGPLSEAFWNLHGKEQLVALGKELDVRITPAMKKSQAVAAFLAEKPAADSKEAGRLELPKELRGGKRPKKRIGNHG